MQRRALHRIAIVLGVAIAYFLAGKLGLSLATVNASTTPVWPPAGIAFATFMIFGRLVAPGILLGAFIVNLTTTGNVATSLAIAVGNTLLGWVGSTLVARFAGGPAVFEHPANIFRFTLAGMASTIVSASIGVASLVLGGLASASDAPSIGLTWWLGDTAGVLVFAPLIYLWSTRSHEHPSIGELAERALMLVAIGAVSAFVFAGMSPMARKDYPLEFLCFPVLAWAVFRSGPRGVSTATVLLSGIAIWGTLHGFGPFHRSTPQESLLLLQAFTAVISMVALGVSAAMIQRRQSERATRRLNEELEERVARRTQQLRSANEELQLQIEQRTRARQELEEAEARLREAQKVARLGSWEWDIEHNRVWWSDELYELYGLDPNRFGASYEAFLELVHPDDRTDVHRSIKDALDQAAPFSFEHRIVRPDGVVMTLLAQGRTVTGPDGHPVRMAGTGQDITERKHAEGQRLTLIREQMARREAEEANRLKEEFLATLSHELRTPLNAIVGWADVLREGHLDATATARAIETIGRNARIQSKLISDILDSSRMTLGTFELKKHEVDLVALVESGLETMAPAAQRKGIRLESRFDAPTVMVHGDSDRLQQVMWNLLTNGIKFAPEGSALSVAVETHDTSARIRVEDEGEGIDPELLPHIFERFRQGDSSSTRRHGGLGLGLAIVRNIVELHGGSVRAENRNGRAGACFTVTLPLHRADHASRAAPRATLPAAPVRTRVDERASSLRGVRVLVVEDDDDSRAMIEMIMSTCGAEVLAAGSAPQAMELLRSRRPDVMISDIEMPGENGYELIARVRALPADQGGATPAIALTAYAGSENANRALRAGYQVHIAKPVEIDALVQLVAFMARGTSAPE